MLDNEIVEEAIKSPVGNPEETKLGARFVREGRFRLESNGSSQTQHRGIP